MIKDLPKPIKNILKIIQKKLKEKFKDNFKCLILYGSWATGKANENSDIDSIVILKRVSKNTWKYINKIVNSIDTNKSITLLHSNLKDFQKEKLPLYTAIKREGKIIYGSVDLAINPEPPLIKYSEFFKKSCEFESQKIEIAKELLKKNLNSGIADYCFVASKHAIQAGLAMKGEGYSSKVAMLLPLAEKYFGKEVSKAFKRLFELYIRSEYKIESLTKEEAKFAIKYAKKVLKVYRIKLNCR